MSDIEVKTLLRLARMDLKWHVFDWILQDLQYQLISSRSPCQVASPDETIPEMEEDPLGDQLATGYYSKKGHL